MRPSVSIIICTRNRAHSLRLTLESIQKADVPIGWDAEIMIVDNGSTDRTRAMVSAQVNSHIPLRCISEPRIGKGHAYNTGIASAKGSMLLFTDDDVRVPTNWISGMCEPIYCGESDAVQGGVRIAPHLERPWLTGSLRVWVAAVEHPDHPPEGLVGANMAFSRAAALEVGGFDPRLGPGAAGFFDDTVFGWELKKQGRRILYRPRVAVEHHFDPSRLKLSSYIDTAHKMAASNALVVNLREPGKPPPKFGELLAQLPLFGVRCVTQGVYLLLARRPDSGFIVRYYYLLYWLARRRLRAQH